MTTATSVGLADGSAATRVLLVDDDGFTRMLLRGALEEGACRVFEAPDGRQALDQLRAEPDCVDLVITDLNMPGMTGTCLVQTLRSEGCTLPIIVLSSNDHVGTAIGVIHDGADDYLLKDENIEETVLFATRKVLDKVRMERENRQLLEALQRSNQDLEAEVVRRQQNEAQIQRDYESRTAINHLLSLAMTGLALEQQLESMLEVVLSVPWFRLQERGAIFLVEEKTGDLVLKAARGLTTEQRARCARLSSGRSGHSACWRVLEEGKVLFIAHDRMEPGHHCTGIAECGRYIVPIQLQHRTIGVVKLYLTTDHMVHPEEEPFLLSVASALASVLERKHLEDALKQRAEYDPLTGFANRALFYDRLTQAVITAQRTGKDLVLMFIDLDRFKQVNDTLGHEAGDRLLQEASRRIAGCLRSTDLLARLGGDEFTIILPWLTHAFYVEYVARRILEELNKPFHLPQGEASIAGSLGITFFPNDADNMEQLLKNADAAMYQAKEAGRNTFRFFTPAMNEAAKERIVMAHALAQAWAGHEFFLHYQLRVAAHTGRPCGVEARLCWQRPGVGVVTAAVFGPHLEQTDLLVPVGLWVLETACRQYRHWLEAGHDLAGLVLPLSMRYLQQGAILVEMIRAVLAETQLAPACLEVEISGAVLTEHRDKLLTLLASLQALGVAVGLRDMGVRPFSPAMLQSLAIRSIKLDPALLAEVPDEAGRVALLRGMLALAKPLRWSVVVEGVDTVELAGFLKEHGCDQLQGALYGAPQEAEACTRQLAQWR
ncbi:MAG: diguanylate cyclase [Magnetococcus sp. DMHC-8]